MRSFPIAAADRVIRAALDEDVGTGDITTEVTVAADAMVRAVLVAKEGLRLAGRDCFVRVFELLDPKGKLEWVFFHEDGDDVQCGERVLTVTGNARTLLTGERTALNLLQRLSGIATLTASWCAELGETRTELVDTRKTTPGLRALEKYAVVVGGGKNHRVGLFDGILIKENHIKAAGSITVAVRNSRKRAPHTLRIEVEVTDFAELDEAIEAGTDAVLLDNMDNETLARAVERAEGRVILEASGNMSKERLASVAATGVDLISAGALTHSAPAVDLSLLFE